MVKRSCSRLSLSVMTTSPPLAPQRASRWVARYFSPSLCKPDGLVSHGREGLAAKRITCRLTEYCWPGSDNGRYLRWCAISFLAPSESASSSGNGAYLRGWLPSAVLYFSCCTYGSLLSADDTSTPPSTMRARSR